ncbi:hypothetical protein EIP91_003460 [Steccherinum ochraceum]|uniref:F-box domain-containing protein n=1 Tax=Steccherinum ochraceum TaxID=92696 RepID=A0A4R0RR32_9APHY|nr:hypothetical protein EIP91_003460 [Steccherinum ochraceum]
MEPPDIHLGSVIASAGPSRVSSQTPAVPQLPIELWEDILERLTDQCKHWFIGRGELNAYSTFSACSLVCRAWVPKSRHLLYTSVHIRNPAILYKFSKALDVHGSAARIGDFVKHLILGVRPTELDDRCCDATSWLTALPLLLAHRLPNVVHLRIYGLDLQQTHVDLCRNFRLFKHVEALAIDGLRSPDVDRVLRLALCFPLLGSVSLSMDDGSTAVKDSPWTRPSVYRSNCARLRVRRLRLTSTEHASMLKMLPVLRKSGFGASLEELSVWLSQDRMKGNGDGYDDVRRLGAFLRGCPRLEKVWIQMVGSPHIDLARVAEHIDLSYLHALKHLTLLIGLTSSSDLTNLASFLSHIPKSNQLATLTLSFSAEHVAAVPVDEWDALDRTLTHTQFVSLADVRVYVHSMFCTPEKRYERLDLDDVRGLLPGLEKKRVLSPLKWGNRDTLTPAFHLALIYLTLWIPSIKYPASPVSSGRYGQLVLEQPERSRQNCKGAVIAVLNVVAFLASHAANAILLSPAKMFLRMLVSSVLACGILTCRLPQRVRRTVEHRAGSVVAQDALVTPTLQTQTGLAPRPSFRHRAKMLFDRASAAISLLFSGDGTDEGEDLDPESDEDSDSDSDTNSVENSMKRRFQSPTYDTAEALLWLLDTSSDPTVQADALQAAPLLQWPAHLREALCTPSRLDILLQQLALCFQPDVSEHVLLPSFNEQRASGLCAAFLFIYWEFQVFDGNAALRWVRESGRPFYSKYENISRALQGYKLSTHEEGSVLYLAYLTLDVRFSELYYAGAILGYSSPTMSIQTLCTRTLLYLAQMSRIDVWRPANRRMILDALSHYSSYSATRRAKTISLMAFAMVLDYKPKSAIYLVEQVMELLAWQLNRPNPDQPLSARRLGIDEQNTSLTLDTVEKAIRVVEGGVSLLSSFFTQERPRQLLDLSSMFHSLAISHGSISRLTNVAFPLLQLTIRAASSRGQWPASTSHLRRWTPASSNHQWISAFLRDLQDHPNVAEDIDEPDIWHATADAFLILARMETINCDEPLVAALNKATQVPSPARSTFYAPKDPIFRLQTATLCLIRTLTTSSGDRTPQSIFQSIPLMGSLVAQPTEPLSQTQSMQSHHIFERDRVFVNIVISSSAADTCSWFDASFNDPCVGEYGYMSPERIHTTTQFGRRYIFAVANDDQRAVKL